MNLALIGLVIFGAAVLGSAAISSVLIYHWVRYGVGAVKTTTIITVYMLGVVVLLFSMFGLVIQHLA